MNSKLRPTLVGMGIALGSSLPACMGQTSSDRADGHSEESPEVQEPRPIDEPHLVDDPHEVDQVVEPVDRDEPEPPPRERETDDSEPTLAAFCDETWPPTKGSPDPPTPLCVDPHDECEGAPLPYECLALLDDNVCDYEQRHMDPLYCVDGQWQCPPGSTSGWECEGDECENTCRCWGPLPEGTVCGENGIEGLGGATGTD